MAAWLAERTTFQIDTQIDNYILDISVWISNRNLKINMTKQNFFPSNFIEVYLTNENYIYLKCTTWYLIYICIVKYLSQSS